MAGLVGIYTNWCIRSAGGGNGDVRQEFSVVFTARPTGGTPTPSSESSEVLWVRPADIATLRMHPSMRQRIDRYLQHHPDPYLG